MGAIAPHLFTTHGLLFCEGFFTITGYNIKEKQKLLYPHSKESKGLWSYKLKRV
jgi:hypothetical protein